MKTYFVVELYDETDDLVGYGVCEHDEHDDETYRMLPEVHGTRSTAHHAREARDA